MSTHPMSKQKIVWIVFRRLECIHVLFFECNAVVQYGEHILNRARVCVCVCVYMKNEASKIES